ncbi:MAG: DUF2304 family protein [Candidatus Omnitrophica bacterium]|nr:DUF2304 family protein [Candidatus Omnitrophota bacterium]
MRNIQILGILVGLWLAFFTYRRFRSGSLRRLDLAVFWAVALTIIATSAFPSLLDFVRRSLNMQIRWLTLVVVANGILFLLVLYLVDQVRASQRHLSDLVRTLARAEFAQAHSGIKAGGTLTAVVIPAFNESDTIQGVLSRLPTTIGSSEVKPIVVVDGATDNTHTLCRDAAHPVTSLIINRGQGDALRAGFEIALEHGADVIVTMDADGQHQPEEVERLVLPVLNDEADLVVGSRFLGEYEGKGSGRHAGIVFFSKVASVLTGRRVSDVTNGFRAIRAQDLMRLNLKESRFSAPEILIESRRKGLRYKEVPVTVANRENGMSKKPPGLRYPLGFGWVMLRTWFR